LSPTHLNILAGGAMDSPLFGIQGRPVAARRRSATLTLPELGVYPIMPDPTLKNVFEAILKYGHDEDFAPKSNDDFKATQAPAGTREKLEVLADRVRRGQPLWHDDDRADYSGLTGAIRPRD
jgi:hypothetical protein